MTDAMKATMDGRDAKWSEVMELAKKYGFLIQAYGGTATLATNKNQYEQWGEEEYLQHQTNFLGGFDRPD